MVGGEEHQLWVAHAIGQHHRSGIVEALARDPPAVYPRRQITDPQASEATGAPPRERRVWGL